MEFCGKVSGGLRKGKELTMCKWCDGSGSTFQSVCVTVCVNLKGRAWYVCSANSSVGSMAGVCCRE